MTGFLLSGLHLCPGSQDSLGRGAVAPPIGLRGHDRLPPSVVQLVSVGVDLLHLVPDLFLLPLWLFFFSVLHFFLSPSTPSR